MTETLVDFGESDSPEHNQISTPINQSAKPKNGGRRPGAGRPLGSKDKVPQVTKRRRASFREAWDNQLERHAPHIVAAYFRAGIRGDSRILLDLANRILGKPTESIELSGPGGAPIAIQAATATALALMSTAELQALASFAAKTGQSAMPPAATRARLTAHRIDDRQAEAIYPPNPDLDGHDANSTSPKASETTDHSNPPPPDQDSPPQPSPEPEPAHAVLQPELD